MSVLRKIRALRMATGLTVAVVLGACSAQGPTVSSAGSNDPLEAKNREMYAFNLEVDRTVIRPLSQAHGKVISPDLHNSISNFADNLGMPGTILNNLMQGQLESAAHNTVRFVFNTTLGIGGLFDPAGDIAGLHEVEADFGQTLHVWGVGEGDYLVLPVLGPSTSRDAVGKVVDFVIDPMSGVIPKPEKYIGTAAKIASKVGDRGRYSETVDSILYDSADGYEQAKLLYLQNRRFELGMDSGDAYLDPYDSPYEDPYDE